MILRSWECATAAIPMLKMGKNPFGRVTSLMTNTSIKQSQQLSEGDRAEKLELFSSILPKLEGYIQQQASLRSEKLPGEYLDVKDFEAIGRIQVWAAVISWDPSKGPLEQWAKRRIWSNMNIVISRQYVAKRIPHDIDSITRPVSLYAQDVCGVSLSDVLPDESLVDPMDDLLEEELYQLTKEKLLLHGNRVAAAILRLSLFPDKELVVLSGSENILKGVRITNKSLSMRLGVPEARVSKAKTLLKKTILELCS